MTFSWKYFLRYDTKSTCNKSGVVVLTCNPCTQDAKAECHEFEASLGYMVRSFLKQTKDRK
jgi:hypothetical protein